ncbi:MAG: hypothetical protein IJS81_07110 [Selenomonadaceae bacterium]|nr:hypothetical protein [Selenomonadaceae bacterium]
MAITKETIGMAVETIKDFFKDLLRPNMELDDIKQITFPRFHELIKKYEKKGYDYGGGKLYVKYVDEKSFKLEFEMYFRDEEERWHKIANESELRDIKLLEDGLIKTMTSLKVVEFPIEAPPEEKSEKPVKQVAPPPEIKE